MFVDTANIAIVAGNGGNGCVSFHREKYVTAGGPDGGDGGRGGNVVFAVDTNMNTLMDFRYKRQYKAQNGQDGRAGKCTGRTGEDLIINVPLGTLIRDAQSSRIIADLSEIDDVFIAARGGNGGWGNSHFATPVRQAPNFAKSGKKGASREVILELKLIADVGLLGFPNAGKSTFLSTVSSARPKIGDYPFTTLVPNLGVVEFADGKLVFADIPGIIEGAHQGTGLGHEFLRHVERTRVLVHLVDVSGFEGRDPIRDFEILNSEVEKYSQILADKEQIVAANKIDIAAEEDVKRFCEAVKALGYSVFPVSAATGKGVKELLNRVYERVQATPMVETIVEEDVEISLDKALFEVSVEDGVFIVEGDYVEELLNSTNIDDSESFAYFQRVLRNSGIIDALKEKGIKNGETVRILDTEFDFEE